MIKIIKNFLRTGKRVLKFRRDYDIETKELKGDNPKKSERKTGSSITMPNKGTISV
jgi:hypothetical protein